MFLDCRREERRYINIQFTFLSVSLRITEKRIYAATVWIKIYYLEAFETAMPLSV
jgi:hypothetical protein